MDQTELEARHDASDFDVRVLLGMALVIIVPALVTLASIPEPRPAMPIPPTVTTNPSPYGYTWSLLLFVVPSVAIGAWVLSIRQGALEKRAFWIAVGVLLPLWCALDVFFGLTFFTFPNTGASVGHFWGYQFGHGWRQTSPLEELGFYAFGFIAMLLVYIWGDAYFVKAYSPSREHTPDQMKHLISFHPRSALVGVVLIALASVYKRWGPHDHRDGLPGYFIFLTLGSILPSVLFYRIARPFINFRALALTGFFMGVVSLFWEAAIGIPYQWWDYNKDQMMGIFIGPLTGLPIEEVILWVSCAWCTVILYETIRTFLRMNRSDVMAVMKDGF